jgi:ATP/maltotriose-dependent transcriptional regulator MalT/DNA-binding SARP family transcriptional activator
MVIGEEYLLRTKLQPPRLRKSILRRDRLVGDLKHAFNHRVTLLIAPTGYGKSTLLAAWLAEYQLPFAWYTLDASDADPFVFMLHLVYGFRERYPDFGKRSQQILNRDWNEFVTPASRQTACLPALHLLINELTGVLKQEHFLIIDDFFKVESSDTGGLPAPPLTIIEEFARAAPPNLHIIITSRKRPALDLLLNLEVHDELNIISKEKLAFTAAETCQLFSESYGFKISEEQAKRLASETEGWVIALQMVWQNLKTRRASFAGGESNFNKQEEIDNLNQVLNHLPDNLESLFNFMIREVLGRQPAEIQRFLLDSSIFRQMTGPICDYGLELAAGESEKKLHQLSEAGLFLAVQGNSKNRSYRYHHLFGEFLYAHSEAVDPLRVSKLHKRAAQYFLRENQPEESLYHLLAGKDWDQAARLLSNELGGHFIETGQVTRLANYIAAFPPGELLVKPALLFLKGEMLRLTSQYKEALAVYRQATEIFERTTDLLGLAQTLRSIALVYIDTVEPVVAEEWLEQSFEVVEKTVNTELQMSLLADLAENKLNLGRLLEAEELYNKAHEFSLRPEVKTIFEVRLSLRRGFLQKGVEAAERAILDDVNKPGLNPLKSEENKDHNRPFNRHRTGRNHREAILLLNYLWAVLGEGDKAIERARQGIALGQELRTSFTEALAWIRLGHGYLINLQYEEALAAYHQGEKIAKRLQAQHLHAEALMGLVILYGMPGGNLNLARQTWEEAVRAARQAGDEWFVGWINLGMAASLTENGEVAEAIQTGQVARSILENCGDQFGGIVARLWLALAGKSKRELGQVCRECQSLGYGFLLEKPSLFGPKRIETFNKIKEIGAFSVKEAEAELAEEAPLTGKNREVSSVRSIFAPASERRPLWVTTLGRFQVLRPDGSEVVSKDWQRDKARLLFQILLTHWERPIPKEQLLDYLWPDSPVVTADSRFKVAMNALVRALEPDKPGWSPSNYINRTREGSRAAYSLKMEPEIIRLDAADFKQLANRAYQVEMALTRNGKTRLLDSEEEVFELYSHALELYQGDLLPGCLYEDWVAPQRENLLSLFMNTALRFIKLLVAKEDWDRCLSICQLILARDNCLEEAYAMTMLALWKQGNVSAALRTYEKCCHNLSVELDVEPSGQISELYLKILNSTGN